jgi:hypothetical protein
LKIPFDKLIQPNAGETTNYPEIDFWIKENFPYVMERKNSDTNIYHWLFTTFGGSLFEFQHLVGLAKTHISKVENPNAVWEAWGGCLYFKNSQDAILFKMRWS